MLASRLRTFAAATAAATTAVAIINLTVSVLCEPQFQGAYSFGHAAPASLYAAPGQQRHLEVDPSSMVNALQAFLYPTADPSDQVFIRDQQLMLDILRERGYNIERAARLAQTTIKHRHYLQMQFMKADMFVCDLYSQVFQFGYDALERPVVWIKLGPISKMVANPRSYRKMRGSFDKFLTDYIRFVAFYIDTFIKHNPQTNSKLTLVVDFENTNEAMSNSQLASFITEIDSIFPGVFEQILHLRFKIVSRLLAPIQNVKNYANLKLNSFVKSSAEQASKIVPVSLKSLANYVPHFNHKTGQEQWPSYLVTGCERRKAPKTCRAQSNTVERMYVREQNKPCTA